MSVFTYYHEGEASGDIHIRTMIHDYLAKHHWTPQQEFIENKSTRLHWQKRLLGTLTTLSEPGTHTLLVYDALELARSTTQVLDILNTLLSRQISIIFIKYQLTFTAQTQNALNELIALVRCIDEDFTTQRQSKATKNIESMRRALGIPLGRPKGSHNKSLKLDRYKQDIMNYIHLGVSKSAIAKLVGCHPQTLYDWLTRNELHVGELTNQ